MRQQPDARTAREQRREERGWEGEGGGESEREGRVAEKRRKKGEREGRRKTTTRERGRAEQVPAVLGWVAGGCGDPGELGRAGGPRGGRRRTGILSSNGVAANQRTWAQP